MVQYIVNLALGLRTPRYRSTRGHEKILSSCVPAILFQPNLYHKVVVKYGVEMETHMRHLELFKRTVGYECDKNYINI